MPTSQFPRLRQCDRLDNLCLSTLKRSLLRAFYVLGKKRCISTPDGLLGGGNHNHDVTKLCEKDTLSPIEEIRSYLFPKLPICYRQQVFEEIFISMACPEFDKNKIVTELEFKFKSYDVVAGTSDMNQIIQNYLKCLLLGYVTKLDFSALYAMESCWVARSRRILHTWNEVKGEGSMCVKKLENGCNEIGLRNVKAMWKDLIFQHGRAVSDGAVASAPYFRELVDINVDHVATGQLVWSIGCNCPYLEKLSLYLDATDRSRYSKHFEDELVSGLTALYGHKKFTPTSYRGRPVGCPKLQTLIMPNLENVEKLEICSAKLLCYLPSLQEIYNLCTARTFEALLNENDFKRKPLSLINIDESYPDEPTTEDICDHYNVQVKYFFPNLTTVKMVQSKHRSSLRILSNFPKVNNLEVLLSDVGELEFGINFGRITHFKNNCRWDEKRLAGFCQRAPNLEQLSFSSGSLHKHRKSRDIISFPALKLITLHNLDYIDPEPFISLIKGTKVLTHIIIEDFDKGECSHNLLTVINDKVIAAIISSLKKLVKFHAGLRDYCACCQYAMTMKSVHHFF